MRLVVYNSGEVVLTVPRWGTKRQEELFIQHHQVWINQKLARFSDPSAILIKSSIKDFKIYKKTALDLAKQRLEYFNKFYNFKYTKVSIRNQKTRWGSCSRRGTLVFNYKIALLPLEIADYIIVHELCHLGEFNHSRNFWTLVAQTIPNYKEIRRKLKS
jgi:predicted metal-dependent hydrolase